MKFKSSFNIYYLSEFYKYIVIVNTINFRKIIYFKENIFTMIIKNSQERHQELIILAVSAIGRKETIGFLNEAAKIDPKLEK